ncbi:hypothetical protein EVAR_57072_1 [Eumeta japonica]|uniref:Uncharacterized protein n=1 Tax=Eumeta variegata TaxID=151549 RepID=A0A4C1YAF8_EUMVA|nr:hypothetical protein EVAR_57072_1 [Eumeta japonica]
MDIRNPRVFISVLPASWVGKRYQMQKGLTVEGWGDPWRLSSNPGPRIEIGWKEFHRNSCTWDEMQQYSTYSVRVQHFTGRAGSFSCCRQIDYSMTLVF